MLEWNNKGSLGQQTPVNVVPLTTTLAPQEEKERSTAVWIVGGAVALGALYFLLR